MAFAVSASANRAAQLQDAAEIVFVRGQGTARELYRIREDGTGLRRLTRNRVSEGAPNVSPDGRLIAFSRFVGGDEELFVMTADGRNVRQLTRNRRQDLQPVWSPDGKLLAFVPTAAARGSPSSGSCERTGRRRDVWCGH